MRWNLVAVVCAALVLAGEALAGPAPRPLLKLDANRSVRGLHFKAHELVRVVAGGNVRRVRASAVGSFALLPPPVDSCSSLLVRATGASGDVAVLRLQGLCPPPSATGAQGADNPPPPTNDPLPDPHGPPSVNLG